MQQILAFWLPGPIEWVVISLGAILLFSKRIPAVGRNLGQGISEFRRAIFGAHNLSQPALPDESERTGRVD